MVLLDPVPSTRSACSETRIRPPSDEGVRWTEQQVRDIASALAKVRPDGERPAGLRTEGQLWIAMRATLADLIEGFGFDRGRFLERTEGARWPSDDRGAAAEPSERSRRRSGSP